MFRCFVSLHVYLKVRVTLSPSLPSPQSSGDEMDEFEVELCKQQGHGLGITIAGLVSEDTGGQSAITGY